VYTIALNPNIYYNIRTFLLRNYQNPIFFSGRFSYIYVYMQPLDKNTLFSIFEAGDEHIYKEHGMEDTLNNPYVLMNMVVKGLENYKIMDQMYRQQYPKQYKNTRNVIQYKYFNKLLGYLERIDTKGFDSKYNIGDSYEIMHNIYMLESLMYYYENIEQYEKCATVKLYVTLLENYELPEVKI